MQTLANLLGIVLACVGLGLFLWFPLMLAGIPAGVLLAAAGVATGNAPMAVGGIALLVALFAIPLLVQVVWRSSAKARGQQKADSELRKLEEHWAKKRPPLDEIERRWKAAQQTGWEARIQARDLLTEDNLRCSLVLVDPRETREHYDETRLAEEIRDLVRSFSERQGFSLEEAKSAIRGAPKILLDDLPVTDAEALALHLRRDFGVSVGIKRRYVGPLPRSASKTRSSAP
jgi:hypothetical protein